MPGQLIYVVDLETGEADTAGLRALPPARRAPTTVDYDLGAATFRKRRGDLELELIVFVLPLGHSDVRLLTIRNHADARTSASASCPISTWRWTRTRPIRSASSRRSATRPPKRCSSPTRRTTSIAAGPSPRRASRPPSTETVRARFLGCAGRDLTNPVMVETGFPDGSREDDGRRVAAFVGEVDVPAGQSVEVAVVLGQTPTPRRGPDSASHPARSRGGPRGAQRHARLVGRAAQRHPGRDQQSRPSTGWSTIGCPTRCWRRGSGAAPARTSAAAPTASATSCRTCCRSCSSTRAWRGGRSCSMPGSSSRKATCSNGGTSRPTARPASASAPAPPTRICGCPMWWPAMSRRPAIGRCWTRSVPYLEAPTLPDGAIDLLVTPRLSREVDSVYDHCQRAIDYTLRAHGRARPAAASAPATGTTASTRPGRGARAKAPGSPASSTTS